MIIRATIQTKLACGALMLIIINVCLLIAIIALISKEIMCKINKSEPKPASRTNLLHKTLKPADLSRDLQIRKTPWLLSFITIPENSLIGGATIISKKWALTTAYCIEKVAHFPLSNKGFRGGSSYWNKNGYYHFATKIIPHYKFDPLTLDFNLAVVEVSPEFINDYETPILIAGTHIINVNRMSSAKIIGWASINMDSKINDYVIQGTVDILSNKICEQKLNSNNARFRIDNHVNLNLNLSTLICGNNIRSDGIDNCSFVHGTSLVNKNESLIGLASWGTICNEKKWPGVYVYASTMIDWINKIQLREEILLQRSNT